MRRRSARFHGLPVAAARDKLSILRVKGLLTLLCRVLLIALCGLAVWRSVRIAAADWLASEGTTESFERAIHFAPENPQLLARAAILRSDNGDPSPAVDEELRRAALMNPFDSALPMTLGLREEFRGNSAGAESYLVRAAEIDHQFKPAWTLANYYYRTNQPDKSWPMIARILSLEPLGFDPTPVFELCWNQAAGSRKILSLIPRRGHRPVQYLEFLINTQRAEAAFEVWPVALGSADPADLGRYRDADQICRFSGGHGSHATGGNSLESNCGPRDCPFRTFGTGKGNLHRGSRFQVCAGDKSVWLACG